MRNDLPLGVIGNLVGDPEQRVAAGVAVARFAAASIPATFDRETNSQRTREPVFLDCSAWRQSTENLAKSLNGSREWASVGMVRPSSPAPRAASNVEHPF